MQKVKRILPIKPFLKEHLHSGLHGAQHLAESHPRRQHVQIIPDAEAACKMSRIRCDFSICQAHLSRIIAAYRTWLSLLELAHAACLLLKLCLKPRAARGRPTRSQHIQALHLGGAMPHQCSPGSMTACPSVASAAMLCDWLSPTQPLVALSLSPMHHGS